MAKHKLALGTILVLFTIRVTFGAILSPLYFKKIIDVLSTAGASRALISSKILGLVYIIIGINLVSIISARIGRFVHSAFSIDMIRELRDFAFQKIGNNSQTFFSNTFAGSLVTKSRRFVHAFDLMFELFIYAFLRFFIILVGVLVVLITQSPLISLIFVTWVLFHVAAVSFFTRKRMKYDILDAEQDSKISGRIADVFSNILAVKFFSARRSEIASFGKYTQEGRIRGRKAEFFGAKIDLMQGVIIFSIQSTLLYIMITLWLKDQISTGTVVLIQTYMVIVFEQLWDFSNSLARFMKSASDMKETIDIFEITPDILDPQKPERLKIKDGRILLKDISFKYSMGGKVFNNLNLLIAPGERIGLVGPSGAGKSTITKLLLRFNEITAGAITIDGQDIRNITQDDLRSVISYVPQEPILFHRPIRENIAYGKPEAAMDEIVEVAKKAHAHDFISKLPKGYDTLVGERGVKLSGGERQRVAIARAMLKNAPILMLDEATSSLDSVSESYIQEALGELMKGKTTIVIAHRLSTIQKMDRIIVLDKGEVVEEGTHQSLLDKKGLYADLWEHQTGGFLA